MPTSILTSSEIQGDLLREKEESELNKSRVYLLSRAVMALSDHPR